MVINITYADSATTRKALKDHLTWLPESHQSIRKNNFLNMVKGRNVWKGFGCVLPASKIPANSEERSGISHFQNFIFTKSTLKAVTRNLFKIAKKLFLNRHQADMSLQFSVDELIQPLVSLSYLSSDVEMEVGSPYTGPEEDQAADSDIEVIACYREAPVLIHRRVVGRGMTLDLSSCRDDESQVSKL